MRYVIALGGNALLRRGEPADAAVQRRHVREAARALAPVVAEHEVIICHGNGPQIGVLADESVADPTLAEPYPLDVLGAQTQGMIGYWLAQELANAGVHRAVSVLVTQTVVDAADPAFATPTKFIGPVWGAGQAKQVAARYGWDIAQDGDGWRRVVASPQPVRIRELAVVQTLVDSGATVVCGGGGGVPVVADGAGWRGVEAVVDKDLTAALIAQQVAADHFVVLTDVPGVLRGFGSEHPTLIGRITVDGIAGQAFAAGSMGPKVEACRRFVVASGRPAVIGALTDAAAVIEGRSGTVITPDADAPVHTGPNIDTRVPSPSPSPSPSP